MINVIVIVMGGIFLHYLFQLATAAVQSLL
jgi:hypothetical protein